MSSSYQLWMAGAPVADDFYDRVSYVEIEENADMPGALQLHLPISRSEDGDLSPLNEAGMQPLSNVAVVATVEGKPPECIFDGYVLGHKIHLESNVSSSNVELYAQDASWMMNLEEKTREWANVTDGSVAGSIFGAYNIAPAPENLNDDTIVHSENDHTLMQRASDIEFLRMLARRSGRLCRVASTIAPGIRVGVFAKPSTSGASVVTIKPNDPEAPNVGMLDIEWDVMRPTTVKARQALFTDSSPTGATGDATASGIDPLDERDLSTFAGQPMTVMLTSVVDDAGALRARAESVLRDAGWFVRCTGEADVAALNTVLRVGQVVTVDTVGAVHSGKYFVWSVRHRIDAQMHKMRFVLVRNAVGAPPSGAGGLLGGLL